VNASASAGVWLLILLLVIVWLPLLAVIFAGTVPFDPGRYVVGRWFRLAAVLAVKLNPLWRFRTSGVSIPDPRRPYVAVSNHESYADIFLISHLPWEMKWLSKQEVFRVPMMGWMMRMAGTSASRRGHAGSRALRTASRSATACASASPSWYSPRAPARRPTRCCRSAMARSEPPSKRAPDPAHRRRRHPPRHGPRVLVFRRARAEARVLEPVETAGMTVADVPNGLRDEVRDRIQEARTQLRKELGLEVAAAS
jgi:hypothetical protein